jgi:hypothetical protein
VGDLCEVAAELSATHADVEQTETLAMVVNGCLVVKLPRDRVDQLVVTGAGQRFDHGHGRQMGNGLSWLHPIATPVALT